MTEREKIKSKISALLAKTTDNGASEAEAMVALKKANELMLEYYISESELQDPFAADRCSLEKVALVKSAYKMDFFFASLCKLFDCFHYFNKYEVAFFGIDSDAKLCCFFYKLITSACLNEKDRYMKSAEFKNYSRYYNGKTLAASFIKGFIFRICERLEEMYQNRNSTIPEGMGLVLVKKEEKVRREYDALNINARSVKPKFQSVVKQVFDDGLSAGDEFNITQGIKSGRRENLLQLA